MKNAALSFIAAVLLAVSSVSAVAATAADKYAIYANGTQSCAKVVSQNLDAKKSGDDITFNLFNSIWVAGYITALGQDWDTERTFDTVLDMEGIMNRIIAYCRNNLEFPLSYAAKDVAIYLAKEAGRRTSAADSNSSSIGECALCEPAVNGDFAEVKRLIADGANPNTWLKSGAQILSGVGIDRATPLMYASDRGHTEIVKVLLAADADVNAANYNGDTALILASVEERAEVVKMLIAAGADLDAKQIRGSTALHFVIFNNNAEIVKMLLDAGANTKIAFNGVALLIIAKKLGHAEIVRLLEEAEAKE